MFILKSIKFQNHKVLGCAEVGFAPNYVEKKNFNTIIIGKNGAGKSNLLLFLAKVFISLEKYRNDKQHSFSRLDTDFTLEYLLKGKAYKVITEGKITTFYKEGKECHANEIELPSKVVVASLSITEKFPLRQGRGVHEYNNYDDYYQYFGVRSRRGQVVRNQFLKTAYELLLLRMGDESSRKTFLRVLTELNYSHKVRYKLRLRKHGRFNIAGRDKGADKFDVHEFIKTLIANDGKSHVSTNLPIYILEYLKDNQTRRKVEKLYHKIESHDGDYHFDLNKFKEGVFFERELELSILQRTGLVSIDDVFHYRKDMEISVSELSSGEAQIMSTFLSIAGTIGENSLVMIDEPDISLHPEWQGQFVTLMHEIFSDHLKSHFVLVTHSPFVISDTPNLNSHILRMERGRENGVVDVWEHGYARSVDEIMMDVFGAFSSRNSEVSKLVASLFKRIKETRGHLERSDLGSLNRLKFITSKLEKNDPLKLLVSKVEATLNV